MAAYARLLNAPRFPLRRTETFLSAPLRHFAKTGSIGRNYFTADCAVILNRDEPMAAFAYCSEGWRLPAFMAETVCGLVGLEIARAVGLDPDPNWDWTPEGATLLLGDLWRP